MPKLTLTEINQHLKAKTLPVTYTIRTPTNISSEELITTLSLFTDNQQMIEFITKLSSSKNAVVTGDGNSITLGTPEKFVHAYGTNRLYSRQLSKDKQSIILEHLKKNKVDKEQLKYLLFNLGGYNIRDLVLESRCFSNNDLIDICNDEAFLKKLNIYDIKLLYHYLNPQRQWKESSTPLLDMFYFTYRIGHVLGLSEKIKASYNGIEFLLESEGNYNQLSLKLLLDALSEFRQKSQSKVCDDIYDALKFSHDKMKQTDNIYQEGSETDLLDRYRDNKLIYLSTGWKGHTVGLAFYGKYLIYCNRGQAGDQRFGCKIFELNDPSLINEALFKKLTNEIKTPEDFHRILRTLVDLQNPVVKFRCRGHKRGTCSLVNPKSSLEAMIVLLQAGHHATKEKLLEVYQAEFKRKKYKYFTEFMRNREIDELIKDMFYAQDSDLIEFFAQLATAIINEHHGKNRGYIKDDREIMRAVDLFERVPEKVQKRMRINTKFMELMATIKIEQQKLLAKKLHQPSPWPHVQYVRYRGKHSYKVSVDNGLIVAIQDKPTPKMHFSFQNAKKLIAKMV
ncbi:MAG: hypothetical protein HYX61_11975 [Gammaproteobacteria bacterium]|jgi:hypothetical protein|nr:hypothetical protein [Gammaproteobacteria bacterium]